MGHLPVPASVFFNDFSADVLEYHVLENGNIIGSYSGLSNSDEDGEYIGFLVADNPHLSVGNVLQTSDMLESYLVRHISYDRYEGTPELLKAYY
ncbi:MAG: hypothetical protein ACLTQL_05625 [Eisenbergiella sp.]